MRVREREKAEGKKLSKQKERENVSYKRGMCITRLNEHIQLPG